MLAADSEIAIACENYGTINSRLIFEENHRNREQPYDAEAKRNLIYASISCLVFILIEVIGGYLSSSLAIASDAVHLLSDFASFLIAILSIWMANRPASRTMSFGWYRAEVIGAFTSIVFIWLTTGILLFLAIQRMLHQNYEINAPIMMTVSCAGLLFNVFIALNLHMHSNYYLNDHHHDNINIRAASLHVIGDFIQGVGVLIASIIIYFWPEWKIADPICTLLFAVIVIITTVSISRDILVVLMEGLPKGIEYVEIMNVLTKIKGVHEVHNLRIWALSLNKIALSAHLTVYSNVKPQTILQTATKMLQDKYHFIDITIQLEEYSDTDSTNNGECMITAN